MTLTVQPIQEAGLDVFIVVLSLRSKSNIEEFKIYDRDKEKNGAVNNGRAHQGSQGLQADGGGDFDG